MTLDLKELAGRLKNGDIKAFDEIYHLFHKKIYFFCLRYGVSQEVAEGITQEVFVKLWLKKSGIDLEKCFQSYLFKISKNILIDAFQKKIKVQAAQNYHMTLILPTNNVEESMDYLDLKNLIDETLMELPERRREVFELSRSKGLSHKEIAKELGISTKTVENHLTLALNEFRNALQKTNVQLFIFALVSIF